MQSMSLPAAVRPASVPPLAPAIGPLISCGTNADRNLVFPATFSRECNDLSLQRQASRALSPSSPALVPRRSSEPPFNFFRKLLSRSVFRGCHTDSLVPCSGRFPLRGLRRLRLRQDEHLRGPGAANFNAFAAAVLSLRDFDSRQRHIQTLGQQAPECFVGPVVHRGSCQP